LKDLEDILVVLSDGKFHSGKTIAQELNCSRSLIWKKINNLRVHYDLEVFAVRGKGYKLIHPIEFLKKTSITKFISKTQLKSLNQIHIIKSTNSTNTLAINSNPELNKGIAWFAEHQNMGKGRRGREWHSPFGRNIYFSLAWKFNISLAEISSLSVAVGATLASLLFENGLRKHELKWPNDLLLNKSKLAGILLEAQGEANGPTTVAIGIGLNLNMSNADKKNINQPFIGLRQANFVTTRNEIAGRLLNSMVDMCHRFSVLGLEPFLETWNRFDKLMGRNVRVISPSKVEEGTYLGLSENGGCRLMIQNKEKTFYAGELSLRTLK